MEDLIERLAKDIESILNLRMCDCYALAKGILNLGYIKVEQ